MSTQFRIADTFLHSLARLSGDEQKASKTTVFDLQANLSSPGLRFHKLEKALDKHFCSVRVNDDLRLIVHRSGGNLLLCYVDHHNKAYEWAERRRIERHPGTGAAEIVKVRQTVRDVVTKNYVSGGTVLSDPKSQEIETSPLSHFSDSELMAFGVPAEFVSDVRAATESALLELLPKLPAEVRDVLLDVATGASPDAPVPLSTVPEDAFEHPDAQRHFRSVSTLEDLRRALDGPWTQAAQDRAGNRADTDVEATVAKARSTAERAERLFSWLLDNNRLISYARAFELIFQEAPVPFRNAVHVPRVLAVSARTAPRRLGDLELRLDSLIVAMSTRRPGAGHFRTAPYTSDEWTRSLGAWPLL